MSVGRLFSVARPVGCRRARRLTDVFRAVCERVVSVCVWRCYRQGVISRAPHLRKDQTKTLRETRENIRERGKGEEGSATREEEASMQLEGRGG